MSPPLRSATRRRLLEALLGLPLVPAAAPAAATPPAAPAPLPAASQLLLEVILFRQPGVAGSGGGGPAGSGASLTPLLAGLKRGGYGVLGHAQATLTIAANATGALRLEDLLPGAGVSGRLTVTRGQILIVHLSAHCAECSASSDLEEKRRVKFGERHYFDGPVIGAILTVNPAAPASAA